MYFFICLKIGESQPSVKLLSLREVCKDDDKALTLFPQLKLLVSNTFLVCALMALYQTEQP